MKKILLLFLILFFTILSYGQENRKEPSVLIELGYGGNGAYTQSIGLITQNQITHHFFVDAICLSYIKAPNVSHTSSVHAMTGVRVATNPIIGKMSLYTGVHGGYGFTIKYEKLKGFGFETFGGINITSCIYCGYYFTYQDFGNLEILKEKKSVYFKNHSFRIGYKF